MTDFKYILVLVTGVFGHTCHEGTDLIATDTQQVIETPGFSNLMASSSYLFEACYIETKDPMNIIQVEIDVDMNAHTSCYFDSIQIFDGPSSGAASLGKFCGTSSGISRLSSGRDMYIVFIGHGSHNYLKKRGFKLKYKQIKDESAIWVICGAVLGVVFIVASICLGIFIFFMCKSKDQVIPSAPGKPSKSSSTARLDDAFTAAACPSKSGTDSHPL
ncbi:tolloid-like protein 2 [Pecten maximus]|uniref:tolloid-like protein 2 n=1 Tax=Pecten maximus TaxID=6579 RepID=UPI00145854FE|nr:tolloid-like protein 2 [Pecten maximus]